MDNAAYQLKVDQNDALQAMEFMKSQEYRNWVQRKAERARRDGEMEMQRSLVKEILYPGTEQGTQTRNVSTMQAQRPFLYDSSSDRFKSSTQKYESLMANNQPRQQTTAMALYKRSGSEERDLPPEVENFVSQFKSPIRRKILGMLKDPANYDVRE